MSGAVPAPGSFGLADAAELAGLLATLSRSGLPPSRVWPVLAQENAPFAEPAGTVAGMLAVGGGTAAGLRLAAQGAHAAGGEGARALTWLMVTAQVAERTGAPIADVYDGLVRGIDAELMQAGEAAVALAGPRATALVLGLLPVAGCGLGFVMGVNTVAVLLGSGPGRLCLLSGAAIWFAGQRWIARLLSSVRPV